MYSTIPVPVSVFISYASEDRDLKNALVWHMTQLTRIEGIQLWQSDDIEAGAEREAEINRRLESANVILLLISSSFFASDQCSNVHRKRAEKLHRQGTARVISIILRSCDWETDPFIKQTALLKDAIPVTLSPNQDAAFTAIVQSIRSVVESLHPQPPQKIASRKLQQLIRLISNLLLILGIISVCLGMISLVVTLSHWNAETLLFAVFFGLMAWGLISVGKALQ